MSFVLMMVPAGVAIALDRRGSWRVPAITAGVLAAVLIFGWVRLAAPRAGKQMVVGLVASDVAVRGVADAGVETDRLLRQYAAQAEALALRGARAVVLPEKLGVVTDRERAEVDGIFQPIADRTRSTVVVGVIDVTPSAKYNRARVYVPGAGGLQYDKRHMLPPFESAFKPGRTLASMSGPSGATGVAICKDMDFTGLSRQYGQVGVGLMLVPAWDFDLDRWWHGHVAIMRGVENGFSIARAAKNGYLTISDNRGRVVAEHRSDSAAFSSLAAEVPMDHAGTLYGLLGDWFGWMSLAVVVYAVFELYRSRKRPIVYHGLR
jgi:apolipoprotein N-acyltransferase